MNFVGICSKIAVHSFEESKSSQSPSRVRTRKQGSLGGGAGLRFYTPQPGIQCYAYGASALCSIPAYAALPLLHILALHSSESRLNQT